jgi:hypothetical protein
LDNKNNTSKKYLVVPYESILCPERAKSIASGIAQRMEKKKKNSPVRA